MLLGKRVRLRDVREEDLALDYRYINDPEVALNKRSGIPYPTTFQKEQEWYESLKKNKDTYDFAIEALDEKLYIGGCGIYEIDWNNGVCEVGIYIGDKNFRGKGYGTEAMKLLLDFIYEQTNLNKVQLEVFSFNQRAICSYKKCGFVVEGRIRQRIFRNGEYHDKVIMGLLREEYTK